MSAGVGGVVPSESGEGEAAPTLSSFHWFAGDLPEPPPGPLPPSSRVLSLCVFVSKCHLFIRTPVVLG